MTGHNLCLPDRRNLPQASPLAENMKEKGVCHQRGRFCWSPLLGGPPPSLSFKNIYPYRTKPKEYIESSAFR